MVSVVYRVVAKNNKEKDFKKIAIKCDECAHESKDCLYYSFFQSITNPNDFIVYYRFTNKKAQDEHIKKLQQKIGPAKDNRDLPAKFLELLQEEELVLFKTK
jgi:quinol monooxygenase YgiN